MGGCCCCPPLPTLPSIRPEGELDLRRDFSSFISHGGRGGRGWFMSAASLLQPEGNKMENCCNINFVFPGFLTARLQKKYIFYKSPRKEKSEKGKLEKKKPFDCSGVIPVT